MTDRFRLAVAQLNFTLGDLPGNAMKIRAARREARHLGADLLLTSELSVTGYPPEDLAGKPSFLTLVRRWVEDLASDTADGGPAVILGAPWWPEEKPGLALREQVYNAVFLLEEGRIKSLRYKHRLPNYGVFDELRVFCPGPLPGPIPFRGLRLGLMVCEDLWTPDAAECLADSGAELLLVPNGSPYETGKLDERHQVAIARITETGLPLVYVNQVGGQDELVFDGASFVLDAERRLVVQLPAFREELALVEWQREEEGRWRPLPGKLEKPLEGEAEVYGALLLGLRDYVAKNSFPGVLLGLSGGIDSALVAALAVDTLGPQRVRAVMLSSPFTSEESREDAARTAHLLGIAEEKAQIESIMTAFQETLKPFFEGLPSDVTEENLQARIRGALLMALSNKFGLLLLTTGNKSEMAAGYATLYGDMCGGFNPLKDLYKTEVYRLARWRNRTLPPGALGPSGIVLPERVLEKAPSAELRPDQKDQDSLPPYEILDTILACLIEGEEGPEALVAKGFEPQTVRQVWRLLDRAEYKRRQAPPGIKITRRAFGRDRRYPITHRFRAFQQNP